MYNLLGGGKGVIKRGPTCGNGAAPGMGRGSMGAQG